MKKKKTVNKLSKCCGCKIVGIKWDLGLGKRNNNDFNK